MARKLLTGADFNNQRAINVADPSAATDAVTLQYLQNFVRGLSWKQPVRAASTANVTLSTPGASIDGVTLATNDRVLLKNQTAGAENGIYIWTGSSSTLTRALDADQAAELYGASVFVTEGTTNGDKQFVQTVDAITLGTTTITFAVFGGGTTYTAGNGLSLAGSTFSVLADPGAGGGILVTASGVKVDPSVVARKYAVAIGDGSATSFTVTHNLGTRDITVGCYSSSTFEEVEVDVVFTSTTAITVNFAVAPASGAYRVVVVG